MSSPRLDHIRIVMVETTHSGNIGSAARAMKTMGLSDLRLVNPKHFPSADASALASGATDILSDAQVCSSLDDAIADAELVIATSGRARHIPWPCVSAREMGELVANEAEDTRIAILIGREDRGLTNDEMHRCNLHAGIPSNPDYGVLNAAAAVQVICYELRMAILGASLEPRGTQAQRHRQQLPEIPWDEPPATQAAQQHLLAHLERLMQKSGFLQEDNPGQAVTRLQRLFLRARPDRREVNLLSGVFRTLENRLDD